MKYWIITDTHFGHKKMEELCGRPMSFENKIMRNIASVVSRNDILIHLGDFCMGNDEHWNKWFMNECISKRWLIKGNHDKKSNTWYHHNGWDFVGDRIQLNIFGKTIIFSHKPISDKGDYINVHGHHHNTGHHPEDKTDTRHKLVYMEHRYAPIDLRRIVEDKY